MKNILVISDNYSRGGLETQIYTLYEELKSKLDFTFVFGSYNEEWDFNDCKIYKDIKFDESSSINDFIQVVDKFVEIIKENNIDLIHVHPFYLSIPAIIASQIAEVPICYTYHGFLSLSFTYNINVHSIFQFSMNEIFSKIFCVYKDINSYLNRNLRQQNCVFMPNPMDINKYNKVEIINNSKWAFISRLSSDKFDSIIDVIKNIDILNIKELHLYGSGDKEKYLKEYVKNNKLTKKIIFHGYTKQVSTELKNAYNGIIGMGRVAEEGIAMQMPVMLCGYGKKCGIIDKNNYELARDNNFAPIFMKSLPVDEIAKQIADLSKKDYKSDIYEKFKKECSSKNIAKKYFEEYKSAIPVIRSNVVYFYNQLKELNNKDDIFSNSIDVLNLINYYIRPQSLDLNMNLNISQNLMHINKMNLKLEEINNEINILNKKLIEIKKENEYIKDRINLKFLIRNTFKLLKNKIRRNK
ncbi:MAG: glycosyltransferase [Bacilli bacterium]|nr:glycosyltransferase [Bacilli bacterium]